MGNFLSYVATFCDRGVRNKCALRDRLARKSIFASIFCFRIVAKYDLDVLKLYKKFRPHEFFS